MFFFFFGGGGCCCVENSLPNFVGMFLMFKIVLSLPESNSSQLKKWNPGRIESSSNHRFSDAM